MEKFNDYDFFREMYFHVLAKYDEYEQIIENNPKFDFIQYFLSNLITAMRIYGNKQQIEQMYAEQLKLF